MRSIAFTRALALALIAAGSGASGAAPATTPAPVPRTIDELKVELERILSESKTPGMALAIVTPEGERFVGGIGLAVVDPPRPADADSMFRIGSTSKAVVALAALKLAREGRLDLEAPLRDLAPEVEYANPWESTDPVRFVHLLEHTTGWDDIHLRDYANQDPAPDNLARALAHDPDSRTSRWRPGTRMAYCNSGPAVAAFVIQRIVGEPFEDWAERELLRPIGMARASYRLTPDVERTRAELYGADGVTPYAYWHFAMRPAGSINASARDMAAYVRFHLRRGATGPAEPGVALLDPADFARMETPRTSLGGRAGLAYGYGLHNYGSFDDDGFLWHGHNGGVIGGASDFSYLPAHGVGYSFLVNATNGLAFPEITKLLRRFLTQDLPRPQDAAPPPAPVPVALRAEHAGWYRLASPRVDLVAPLEAIAAIARVSEDGDALRFGDLSNLGGDRMVGMPGEPRLLRRESHAAASVALVHIDDLEAPGLVAGMSTFVKVPVLSALTPLAIASLWNLMLVAQLLFLPVWVIRALLGKVALRPHLEVRLWPLAAGGAVLAFVLGIGDAFAGDHFITRYPEANAWSVGLAVTSVLAVVVPWFGLWRVMRVEHVDAHRGLRRFSLATLAVQAAFALLLVWMGAVPFVTWT